jgi:alcohol dehydrogenase
MTDVELVEGTGAIDRLPELVAGFAPRRILVVGGPTGLGRAGVATLLGGYEVTYFSDVTPNPRLPDVLRGCAAAEAVRPDLIVGAGGGSALDVAKMVRALPVDRRAAVDVLTGTAPPPGRAPLLLVPTTAGTGSEVTCFATVYVDGVKHSLDHPSVHADVAVVDPALTSSCPADVTYAGGFDALAHAIESLWALRSTTASRAHAADALAGLVAVLARSPWPMSATDRATLSRSATRAGLAIDRTRTTGAHAFAYPLTARFDVRHGLACALNLVWLLPYTALRLAADVQDPRGAAFVARRLAQIAAALGADDPAGSGPAVAGLLVGAGFSPRLRDYGVAGAELAWLVQAALGSGRSANGPVRLAPAAVLDHLREIVTSSGTPP